MTGDALLLGLALGEAGPGDLRVGVDHGRDGAVVEGRRVAGDDLGGDLRLAAGLVGEHRAGGDVADGEDARVVGAAGLVGADDALVVHDDLGVLEAEVGGVGLAADGDQDLVEVVRRHLAVVRDGDAEAAGRRLDDALHARLDHDLLEPGADVLDHDVDQVGVGADQQAREELGHRDLAAEALVDQAELEADVAAADHEQACRARAAA